MSSRNFATNRSPSRDQVLLVGGDARQGDHLVGNTLVRAIASTKHGGNGGLRALIASIHAGSVRCVVLLVRWLGHSESGAIRKACRAVGVRCLLVTTGLSAARATIDREVARG